jgi:hypothetical protein
MDQSGLMLIVIVQILGLLLAPTLRGRPLPEQNG